MNKGKISKGTLLNYIVGCLAYFVNKFTDKIDIHYTESLSDILVMFIGCQKLMSKMLVSCHIVIYNMLEVIDYV